MKSGVSLCVFWFFWHLKSSALSRNLSRKTTRIFLTAFTASPKCPVRAEVWLGENGSKVLDLIFRATIVVQALPVELLRLTSSVLSVCSVSSLPCAVAYLIPNLLKSFHFSKGVHAFETVFSVVTWFHGLSSKIISSDCSDHSSFPCLTLALVARWGSVRPTPLCCVCPCSFCLPLLQSWCTSFSPASALESNVERCGEGLQEVELLHG